jgi:ribosome-associated translation inhibitor RaiA
MDLQQWLEQLRLRMTTHIRVSIVSKVEAIERHADVITSKFGATMQQSTTTSIEYSQRIIRHCQLHFGHTRSEQEQGHASSFARFDNVHTNCHCSIQSRPSVSMRYMFCSAWFSFSFFPYTLNFKSVEESTSGGVNLGMRANGWLWRCIEKGKRHGATLGIKSMTRHNDIQNSGV